MMFGRPNLQSSKSRSSNAPEVTMQIVCDGNSLTLGIGVASPPTNSYPEQLAALFTAAGRGVRVVQFGISGQTSAQMSEDAPLQIDRLYDPVTYQRNILVAWEGTNTLLQTGNVTQALDDFKAYCLARKAAGWEVLALTMIAGNATYLTEPTWTNRATYNTEILNFANYGVYWDGVVDVGADSRIYGTVYYDNLHLKEVGYGYVAEDVYNHNFITPPPPP